MKVEIHKYQNRIPHNNINKTYDIININRKLEEQTNQENTSKKKFIRKQAGITIVKRDSFLTLRDSGNSLSQSILQRPNYREIVNAQIQIQDFEKKMNKNSTVASSPTQKTEPSQPGFKYLRNLISNPKFDLIPTKKILDHKTRENTPIPRQEKQVHEQNQKQSKINYLQKKLKESEQKFQQLILLKDKYEDLKKQYEAQKQNVSKLIEKLSICMKQKDCKQQQIRKLEQQLKNGKGSVDEKMNLVQMSCISKIPSKLITIVDNKSNLQLEKQNKKLNMDIEKIRQQIRLVKQQNIQLIKMNETYQKKLSQKKDEYCENEKEKIICLQNCIVNLKNQINKYKIIHDTECNTSLLQTTLINLKKQLNYYRIATYCLKKQLSQAKIEISKKISKEEYQDLKTRYKKLIIKHRQSNSRLKTQKKYTNKKNQQYDSQQEAQFQLTPEKETIIHL